jgi:hypothetical protein
VRSFLLTRDYFRYVFPAKNPSGKDLFYVPYWRFKGALLFTTPAGNDYKFVDVSQCAADIPGIPRTLGLRAQAMKLKFAAPEMEGHFITPATSFAETFKTFQRRFNQGLPKPILCSAHLGESMGMLYSPFYAQERLYDAVLDQPTAAPSDGFSPDGSQGAKLDWKAQFMAALCPDCGWDLEGERDALVLHCRNCRSAWYPSRERLTRVEAFCMRDAEAGCLYLPFWQMNCDISEVTLKNYADLLHLANLPRIAEKSFEEREFRFWTPAFKVRAPAFLRLAESLTLIQAQPMLAPSLPAGRHHPVTLPVEEACESLKIVLAGFLKPRSMVVDLLPGITIHPTQFRLAYLPFQEDPHDYFQPQTQVAINKNLLSLSRNL